MFPLDFWYFFLWYKLLYLKSPQQPEMSLDFFFFFWEFSYTFLHIFYRAETFNESNAMPKFAQ